jgi:hypothetical protein
MDWLYDRSAFRPGEVFSVVEFLRDPLSFVVVADIDDRTEYLWRGTLRALNNEGSIMLSESMDFAGTSAMITDQGRTEVEARRAREAAERQAQQRRRADPVLRRAAAVNGLLRWLYDQDTDATQRLHIDQVLTSEHAMFEGERLPEAMIRRAAQHLQDNELICGDSGVAEIEGPITAQITPLGQDCVESGGNVADYLRRKTERAANITNFHGTVSGNVSWDSTHVTQTATTTGLAGDEIGVLVRAIAEAIPALGLPDEQAATVRDSVDVIEGELAHSDPDRHILKMMMRRTLEALTGATSGTLGLLLTGYAKQLMRNAGIPIE